MKLLLDENVPRPMADIVRILLKGHEAGLHRFEYRQNNKHGGLIGLGTAIATVCAGLPHALAELARADGQRLISLKAIDPSQQNRMRITDPALASPKFWPDSQGLSGGSL